MTATTDNTKETGRAHALLSPSSASRWMSCTPSAVAEAAVPDRTSVYALEGSLAHAVCERTLLERLGRDTSRVCAEIDRLAAEYGSYPEEIDAHAAAYADTVMAIYEAALEEGRAEIHIETPLDLGDWAPGSFGTADAVVIGPHSVTVIDFKYGRGVAVDARGNAQMRMYALGALDEFGVERAVELVRMMIIQPRLSSVSQDILTPAELLEWGEERLRPLAAVAARGLGARQAGKWCRFCRVADTCAEMDRCARIAEAMPLDRLTGRMLGERCLPLVAPLEQWIESVRSAALKELIAGGTVPGYKMVRKKTQRKITDAALAIDKLRADGFDDSAILRAPALRTLTELERVVGKKRFAELMGDLIVKPEGEPTIAEESDRRAAVTPASSFDYIDLPEFE